MTSNTEQGGKVRHTPGPWAVEDPMDFELTIVEANKPTHEWKFIASLSLPDEEDHDFTSAEVHANAYLVAAAPDLLAALKELRSVGNDMAARKAARAKADAAIQKAAADNG